MYDEWIGCYDLGWKGLLIPEAFSHPAKFSRALIFRILEHALAEGMIQPGQTIIDPFGGVALGALPALMAGLNWVGCELEARFVGLGRKNIDLWNAKFSSMPKWTGSAQLLQGDSRRLAEVIAGAGCVVSSPPYANQETPDWSKKELSNNKEYDRSRPSIARVYGSTTGQLAALKEGDISAVISSPPFAGNTGGRGEASRNGIDAALFDRHSGGMKKGTGSDPANLDHLPMGTIGAVVGSPPFAGSIGSDDPAKRGGILTSDPKRAGDMNLTGSYGQAEGQLGAMVVGSPPFEDSIAGGTAKQTGILGQQANGINGTSGGKLARSAFQDYGQTPGQIGTESGETFWTAARLIVTQCHPILPDNAAAIWVVKSYVKNGKVVDFPGQWQALCEACGFELKHEHRAMLVKNGGIGQTTVDGEVISQQKKRASFFRLLAEKKGAPRIDWETVLCFQRKP